MPTIYTVLCKGNYGASTQCSHLGVYGPVTYHRIELTDRYRIKQILSGGEKASTAENLEIFPLANEHVPNMYRMCNGWNGKKRTPSGCVQFNQTDIAECWMDIYRTCSPQTEHVQYVYRTKRTANVWLQVMWRTQWRVYKLAGLVTLITHRRVIRKNPHHGERQHHLPDHLQLHLHLHLLPSAAMIIGQIVHKQSSRFQTFQTILVDIFFLDKIFSQWCLLVMHLSSVGHCCSAL